MEGRAAPSVGHPPEEAGYEPGLEDGQDHEPKSDLPVLGYLLLPQPPQVCADVVEHVVIWPGVNDTLAHRSGTIKGSYSGSNGRALERFRYALPAGRAASSSRRLAIATASARSRS